jgi:HPt (histidine-containing phosphotransfer) domain-containing protein
MTTEPTILDPAALERLEEWGGPGLQKEIVQLFLEHGPVRMDQIRGALDGEDLEVPERGAHSLKSSAANVGAHHVHRVAGEVELAASQGDLQSVRDLIPDLEEAYAEATRELKVIVEEDGDEA